MAEPDARPVHISIVLDRSGSMNGIADDVVGGFNEFLRRQRREPGAARVTLVQFDGENPFELLIDGAPLDGVRDLERSRYQPRGMTPLFDAVGRMIGRIDRVGQPLPRWRAAGGPGGRHRHRRPRERQREHTRESIFRMVEHRKAEQDWVFVFLGANQDSYAEGAKVGVAPANASNWAFSGAGTRGAFDELAAATVVHRRKSAPGRADSKEAYLRKAGRGKE